MKNLDQQPSSTCQGAEASEALLQVAEDLGSDVVTSTVTQPKKKSRKKKVKLPKAQDLYLSIHPDSTSAEKDLEPYWNEDCLSKSESLWLPTATGSVDPSKVESIKSSSKTLNNSWFSKTLTKHENSQPVETRFSKSPLLPNFQGQPSEVSIQKCKKIRIYPTAQNKKAFRAWQGASRFAYNRTVEYFRGVEGPRPPWIDVRTWILDRLPSWVKSNPCEVYRMAIKEACDNLTECKRRALVDGKPHELGFKSKKDSIQSCFIPKTSVLKEGVYPRLSGKGLRYVEKLPESKQDCRLTEVDGKWYICIPTKELCSKSENQGRIVAIDPGVRKFITYYSEDSYGEIGSGDFSKIFKLLRISDKLTSEASKSKCKVHARRRRLRAAAQRTRNRVRNLIDEIHHKAARYLVDNFDIILLPTFEVSQMVRKLDRKIRSKTARSMLTWSHFRFKQFLKWKAFECGKQVIDVSEAWTSKTCSWSGEIKSKLGGAKKIKGSDGVVMDRDANGARGIFLRALRDTSILMVKKPKYEFPVESDT